jgi:hypothetical protein
MSEFSGHNLKQPTSTIKMIYFYSQTIAKLYVACTQKKQALENIREVYL